MDDARGLGLQSGMVTASDKAFDLLELITTAPTPLGLGEVVRMSGLKHATVRRSLLGLARQGLVHQNDKRAYVPGLRLLDLTALALDHLDLAREAEKVLRELCNTVPGTVTLAVYSEKHLAVALSLVSSEPYRVAGRGLAFAGLHATAAGKAVLAHLSRPDADWVLGPNPLPRYTPHTITKREILSAQLATIARRGFALNDQESLLGVRCLAAPVWNHLGRPTATVSVAVAVSQVSLAELGRAAGDVCRAAHVITDRIGGSPAVALPASDILAPSMEA